MVSGHRGPGVLRWLAALVIRGPDARFILAELDEAMERELARGIPPWRARWRYAVNAAGSALSLARARRRAPVVAVSWLDVKLGVRMLVKYPGLTGVAVLALGIGIPVGLAPSYLVNAIEAPLPVARGARVRLLRYWNTVTSGPERPTSYDFALWRDELTAFTSLGAVRMTGYNIESEGGLSTPVAGAEVTASTFDILRVPPLLGRTLVAGDERPGAPAVVVVGFDLWRSRLAGDPDVIGSTLRLGRTPYTVVGVMPEGFLFPVRHQLWLPLTESLPTEPRQGPGISVFGRLAEGASPEDAQAELSAIGRGMAADFPEAQAGLQPEVVPFSFIFFGFPKGGLEGMPEFSLARALALVLLVVASINVALLIFARTATRSRELAVRTALGARRGRIISQVFAESLVLAVVAAGVGLLSIKWLPGRLLSGTEVAQALPWWVDPGVTPRTALWAFSLAVLGAVVAGVLPALRVTGKAVQRNIQGADAGRSGIRFGGMSSALIVADVAIAVTVVGVATGITSRLREAVEAEDMVGIPAEEFLAVELGIPRTESAAEGNGAADRDFAVRVAATQRTLVERLEGEPGVGRVAMASVLPRMDHPIRWAEVEGEPLAGDRRGAQIRTARVGLDFFDALDQPIVSGRGFDAGDLEEGSAVIVNTTFVERVLGGRNPIGRRVRYRSWRGPEPTRWYEIVGVVGHLGMHMLNAEFDAGLYHPMAPGQANPVWLAIHVDGNPGALTPRVRELATEVEPAAIIRSPTALDAVHEGDWYIALAATLGGGILVVILLALAASGIYAIMSFTVAERTREIGIRVALGAQRSDIVLTVVKRALVQLGVGVLLGMPLAGRTFFELRRDVGARSPVLGASLLVLALGVGVMVLIGLMACTAPTHRALRITPTEALREG